jgi:hypothetical protein
MSPVERLCVTVMVVSITALMVLFPLLIVTGPGWRG